LAPHTAVRNHDRENAKETHVNDKFRERMAQPDVARDTRTLADFVQIWCDGHHVGGPRRPLISDAAELGVYLGNEPILCEECAEHLRYAEKRRAYCPQDPKPFCAHCEVHCYRSDEREWQRAMMRYSGPRSWRKGHAIAGVKHALEGRKWRKEMERRAKAESATPATTTSGAGR
jgi:hypothetical protein